MKHYCVTYYDGKGDRYLYVHAKSINAAKAAANDILRQQKVIGASVLKAEKFSMPQNTMWSRPYKPIPASEVARIIKERR